MKLEKYVDKNKKRRKTILISISVIVLISISFLLYKTFASFSENVEFPIMKGQVDYFGNSDVYFAFYNENDKLKEMPLKDNDQNLIFDHGECDNGASIEWNEEEWGPVVKNLSKSKTKCSLYFIKYQSTIVDYVKELANIDSTNLWTDDTSDANIRYVGATPNNYIDIGDRDADGNPILWRIIGLMNNVTYINSGEQQESLVKIVRADKIGDYTWDSSPASINGGLGISEWSQSDIMKLLNPKDVYNDIPAVGASLYWNKESGKCVTSTNETNDNCTFTSSGINDVAKKKIAKVRWNTGTAIDDYVKNVVSYTANYIYNGERSSHNSKELCASNGGNYCNDEVERKTTWDGYLGLIYSSDYGYAVGKSVRNDCLAKAIGSYGTGGCGTNDWLKPSGENYYWTMTTVSDLTRALLAFYIHPNGGFAHGNSHYANAILPVGYLKPDVKILFNSKSEQEYGSEENPFVIE